MNFRPLSSGLLETCLRLEKAKVKIWRLPVIRTGEFSHDTSTGMPGNSPFVSVQKRIYGGFTSTASYRSVLPSFSSILTKSLRGGCGTSDRHDCSESAREPYPPYEPTSCFKVRRTWKNMQAAVWFPVHVQITESFGTLKDEFSFPRSNAVLLFSLLFLAKDGCTWVQLSDHGWTAEYVSTCLYWQWSPWLRNIDWCEICVTEVFPEEGFCEVVTVVQEELPSQEVNGVSWKNNVVGIFGFSWAFYMSRDSLSPCQWFRLLARNNICVWGSHKAFSRMHRGVLVEIGALDSFFPWLLRLQAPTSSQKGTQIDVKLDLLCA